MTFGHEASAFTKLVVEGKQVYLEYEQGSSTKDRYGRTLAYIYLQDGTLLNKEIIEQGYGYAYTRFPFSKMDEFRAAQRRAQSNGRVLGVNYSCRWTVGSRTGAVVRQVMALSVSWVSPFVPV